MDWSAVVWHSLFVGVGLVALKRMEAAGWLSLLVLLLAQLGAAAWWCGVWLWFSMLARVTSALQKVRRHG